MSGVLAIPVTRSLSPSCCLHVPGVKGLGPQTLTAPRAAPTSRRPPAPGRSPGSSRGSCESRRDSSVLRLFPMPVPFPSAANTHHPTYTESRRGRADSGRGGRSRGPLPARCETCRGRQVAPGFGESAKPARAGGRGDGTPRLTFHGPMAAGEAEASWPGEQMSHLRGPGPGPVCGQPGPPWGIPNSVHTEEELETGRGGGAGEGRSLEPPHLTRPWREPKTWVPAGPGRTACMWAAGPGMRLPSRHEKNYRKKSCPFFAVQDPVSRPCVGPCVTHVSENVPFLPPPRAQVLKAKQSEIPAT